VKLHATGPSGVNTITAYGEDYVAVNGQRHGSSLIVTPDRVMPWDVSEFAKITAEHFQKLKSLDAEIILLGTGKRQRFPHPSLTAALVEARIGLEVMDVKAACRTYNILIAEERKVAVALILGT
jgi:uncharacterized protein